MKVVAAFLLWTGVTTILACLAAGPYARHLGPVAVPAGLTIWAIRSGRMDSLLLRHSDLADRSEMFYLLTGDALVWFALVVSVYLAVSWVYRLRTRRDRAQPLKNTKAAKSQGNHSTHDTAMGNIPGWFRNLMAIGLTMALALLLLKFFAQSGRVQLDDLHSNELVATVPAIGQIVFALLAAFFLATLVATQLFVAPLGIFLSCPLLVACIGYIYMAQQGTLRSLAGAAPFFVPANLTFAAILPVQYLALGSLGVIAGFWFSLHLHAAKHTRNQEQD